MPERVEAAVVHQQDQHHPDKHEHPELREQQRAPGETADEH